MPKFNFESFLNRFLIYLVILYTFFMLGRAIWINFELRKKTLEIENQISDIKKQNMNLENLILYYKSDSFREVEARQKLGLKKPDEKVVSVPVKKVTDVQDEIQSQAQNIADKPKTENLSNWQLWWQYFTKS